MSLQPFTGAKRLRELLSDPTKIVCAPGVQDGLTARLCQKAGFDAIYMTGAGTSMAKLGWADLGMATLNDMHDNASMIASLAPSLPLIADADTGYGGPIMVSRTVAKYARSGIAAMHLEDQVQEKRCGHLMGKQLVDREVWYSKLAAAVSARDQLQSDMMIIARTDSRQSLGFDEAIERLRQAEKIGVDILFLEALRTKEEARIVCETFPNTPVLLNMVPGGVTPWMTADEAKSLGFRMMIWPGATLEPIIDAVTAELSKLKQTGTTSTNTFKVGIHTAFDTCGLQECLEIDRKAGGKAYATVNDEHPEVSSGGDKQLLRSRDPVEKNVVNGVSRTDASSTMKSKTAERVGVEISEVEITD